MPVYTGALAFLHALSLQSCDLTSNSVTVVADEVHNVFCQLDSGDIQDAQVTFAGLAPGMVGVYQIDIRLPSGFKSGKGTLSCALATRLDLWEGGRLPLCQRSVSDSCRAASAAKPEP
jgi:hypothetical protein